ITFASFAVVQAHRVLNGALVGISNAADGNGIFAFRRDDIVALANISVAVVIKVGIGDPATAGQIEAHDPAGAACVTRVRRANQGAECDSVAAKLGLRYDALSLGAWAVL